MKVALIKLSYDAVLLFSRCDAADALSVLARGQFVKTVGHGDDRSIIPATGIIDCEQVDDSCIAQEAMTDPATRRAIEKAEKDYREANSARWSAEGKANALKKDLLALADAPTTAAGLRDQLRALAGEE